MQKELSVLNQISEDVFVHESEFIKSNAVIVQGKTGVLLIDPGITKSEMIAIADDIRKLELKVVAGFSTHPHWDHVLWHSQFGDVPRYGTASCGNAIKTFLSNPSWKKDVQEELPPEIEVPLNAQFGKITGLAAGVTLVPWDGPKVRIIEHNAHAAGHAALLVEKRSVLIAGDLLSDVLIPMLDFSAKDPINDHLKALQLLESVADNVEVFVPGHGSVGNSNQLCERIKLDRSYLETLSNNGVFNDPRIDSAKPGWEWVADVHAGQVRQLAKKY